VIDIIVRSFWELVEDMGDTGFTESVPSGGLEGILSGCDPFRVSWTLWSPYKTDRSSLHPFSGY